MEENLVKDLPTQDKPKKKVNGFLIFFLILLAIPILIGIVGYMGYKKIVNNTSTQVDLGVTYSMADIEESFAMTGSTGGMCLDCKYIKYGNPHQVDATFTNSQATAILNLANHDLEYGELDNLQVKFSENKAELSALFTYEGKTYPVYISGTGGKASDTTIQGQLDSLKVGGISLPTSVRPMLEKVLIDLANGKLAEAGDTLRIDTIEITENGLHFEGLAPSTFEKK